MLPDCEWSRIVEDGEEVAKALTVCHTVTKHPDQYQAITGKDAGQAERQYREFINFFRKDL